MFHSNNISDSVAHKFIMLNMLVTENKHGIVPNSFDLFPTPPFEFYYPIPMVVVG